MDPTNAHTGTSYASLSGTIEPIRGWRWQFPGLHHYWWWDVMSIPQALPKTAVYWVVACKFPTEEKVKDGKVMYPVFWDRKEVILLVSLKPRQAINSDHCVMMLTKLKAQISRVSQRGKQPFSCSSITPGPIPVWRPWSTLLTLGGLSYHTQCIV